MRIALAMVAVAALAFAAGYEVARLTVEVGSLQEELAAIRSDLATLKRRPTQAAAVPRRRGPDPDKVYDVKAGKSPAKGAEDAAVTIVEFSDFQCPFCGRVGPTLAQVLAAYPEQVKIVYKHFPLSGHRQALPAARAAVAAARQGKFWEMHDLLFANQRDLSDVAFKRYAQQLGLDVARFEKDYASPQVLADVQADAALARELGVSGTPGFFINGRFVSGALPFASFKARIDEALKEAS